MQGDFPASGECDEKRRNGRMRKEDPDAGSSLFVFSINTGSYRETPGLGIMYSLMLTVC